MTQHAPFVTDRSLSIPPRARPWVVLIAIVVLVNAFIAIAQRKTGNPGGPTSSTYTTGASGLAAYAELLERSGHDVHRLRTAISRAKLDADSTLVVLDPASVDAADAVAIDRFVRSGGHLVAGGHKPAWTSRLLIRPPRWTSLGAARAEAAAAAPEVEGVRSVTSDESASWSSPGEGEPVLVGTGGRSLLVVAPSGNGRIALLATASPLDNAHIAAADNAALGLALAGPPSRRVVFAEGVHGLGQGLGAIPSRWRWFLGDLVLACLAWLFGRARRLGPPEGPEHPPAPARRLYVEAVGASLTRSRPKNLAEAAEPVRRAALDRLARRAALDPHATPAEVRGAAVRFGLDAAETDALISGPRDEQSVLAAGRASAKLHADRT